jgi:hypothetical protein
LGTLAFFTLTRLLAVSLNPALATSWQAELETPLPYDRAMLSFVCQVACAVGNSRRRRAALGFMELAGLFVGVRLALVF